VLAASPSGDFTVEADGREYRAASLILANGRHYAGRYVIAPAADLSRPSFELCLFAKPGRVALLGAAVALLTGRFAGHPDVTRLTVREVTVRGTAPEPVELDGDVGPALPVTFTAGARLIRVRA